MHPIIICITGAHSGSGKTSVAEAIIKGIPIQWGAIKYTKTSLYSSIIDDKSFIDEEGKDTARMKKSGAKQVLWIQARQDDLGELLEVAMERLSDIEGVIVEGNSPVEHLSPDFIVFVFGEDTRKVKESAKVLIERADYILCNERLRFKPSAKVVARDSLGINEIINDIIKRLSFEKP